MTSHHKLWAIFWTDQAKKRGVPVMVISEDTRTGVGD